MIDDWALSHHTVIVCIFAINYIGKTKERIGCGEGPSQNIFNFILFAFLYLFNLPDDLVGKLNILLFHINFISDETLCFNIKCICF